MTPGLTNHSSRRGAAQEADLHGGVSLPEIVARGGRAVDGVQKVFTYVTQNVSADTKCARALSEWPNTSEGVLLPSIICINGLPFPYVAHGFVMSNSRILDVFQSESNPQITDSLLEEAQFRFHGR